MLLPAHLLQWCRNGVRRLQSNLALDQQETLWCQALEDLETCGQSELLREIEVNKSLKLVSINLYKKYIFKYFNKSKLFKLFKLQSKKRKPLVILTAMMHAVLLQASIMSGSTLSLDMDLHKSHDLVNPLRMSNAKNNNFLIGCESAWMPDSIEEGLEGSLSLTALELLKVPYRAHLPVSGSMSPILSQTHAVSSLSCSP